MKRILLLLAFVALGFPVVAGAESGFAAITVQPGENGSKPGA